jgi:hypothetical protein
VTEERTVENGWRTSEETCPHCGVSLQGEPVPEHYLIHDSDCTSEQTGVRCFCLPYGKVTHFGRKIGIEVQGVYDGVLYWQCPDCGGKWHRWDNPEMRQRAERFVNGTAK